MIAHIVTFHWRDDVTPERVAGLSEALTAMATKLPSLRSYHHGENLRLRPDGADYAVVAVVADAEGLEAYLDSPEHQQVFADHLSGMIAERSAVQLPVAAGLPG